MTVMFLLFETVDSFRFYNKKDKEKVSKTVSEFVDSYFKLYKTNLMNCEIHTCVNGGLELYALSSIIFDLNIPLHIRYPFDRWEYFILNKSLEELYRNMMQQNIQNGGSNICHYDEEYVNQSSSLKMKKSARFSATLEMVQEIVSEKEFGITILRYYEPPRRIFSIIEKAKLANALNYSYLTHSFRHLER